jgi:hypothetical protein
VYLAPVGARYERVALGNTGSDKKAFIVLKNDDLPDAASPIWQYVIIYDEPGKGLQKLHGYITDSEDPSDFSAWNQEVSYDLHTTTNMIGTDLHVGMEVDAAYTPDMVYEMSDYGSIYLGGDHFGYWGEALYSFDPASMSPYKMFVIIPSCTDVTLVPVLVE